ncbi:hypothetical protein [Amycolatopsis circi]|uniref:hypothetical protein n=1 Tax=Amycolatopsis circi TaxID=871959 RepID=UPI000E2843EE|nr:hypothetical protein [Amycolatopsis circi]
MTVGWNRTTAQQQEPLVRAIVRKDVEAALGKESPHDLGAAADAVWLHTGGGFNSQQHGLTIKLEAVQIRLDEEARRALADHEEASRLAWQRAENLTMQTKSLRDLLKSQDTGLAWLLRQHGQIVLTNSIDADRLITILNNIAAVRPVPSVGKTLVDQLVDLMRQFVAPITEPAQKQLFLQMLPFFFTHYGRDDLAQQAEELAKNPIDERPP